MDMHSRNQYLKTLQQRYFQAQSKKEKSSILNEYCRNTHQNRKYVISKINSFFSWNPQEEEEEKADLRWLCESSSSKDLADF